jgi:2-dehydropantoate 2-reductase
MLQDHIKGRRTEIDMINGLVANESRRLGLPTPVSDVLVTLNRRITAGELKPDAANLDLALSMLK